MCEATLIKLFTCTTRGHYVNLAIFMQCRIQQLLNGCIVLLLCARLSHGVNAATTRVPPESRSSWFVAKMYRVVEMKLSSIHKAALERRERVNACDRGQGVGHRKWRPPNCAVCVAKCRINPLNTVKRRPDAATRFTYWHDGAGLIYASSKLLLCKHASCAGLHREL